MVESLFHFFNFMLFSINMYLRQCMLVTLTLHP